MAGGAKAAPEVPNSEKKEKTTAGTGKLKVDGKGGKVPRSAVTGRYVSRSAVTGRYVSAVTEVRHPQTTVVEIGGVLGLAQSRSESARLAKGRVARPLSASVTQQQPTPRTGVSQAELDRVLVEVRQVWAGNAAMIWMTSANAQLEGNRPLDVLAVEGPGPVLQALEAGAWGGAS